MNGDRAIAENRGRFLVVEVDGEWFDAAVAGTPELRQLVGPVPQAWIVGPADSLRNGPVSGTSTGCATRAFPAGAR